MFKLLYPRSYAPSIVDIHVEWLKKLGIRGVLFDMDNTIVRSDSNQFSPEVIRYINELRRHGLKVGIVSNNRRRRVSAIAASLNLPAIHRAIKPFSRPFRKALKMLGTSPEETALVGDQIFTDILGGNRMGLHTILVNPMEGKDFWGSRLISRQLEKLVLPKISRRTKRVDDYHRD